MLSISAPVDIASLASGTSTLGARAVIRAAKNGAWHCEETECAQVLATSGGKAFAALDELVANYRDIAPALATWLENSVPEGLAVFTLPEHHRRRLRTSNPEHVLKAMPSHPGISAERATLGPLPAPPPQRLRQSQMNWRQN